MDLKVEIYFISAKGMKESRKISPGYDRNKQLCRYRGKSCRKPLSNRLIYGESRIHNHFSRPKFRNKSLIVGISRLERAIVVDRLSKQTERAKLERPHKRHNLTLSFIKRAFARSKNCPDPPRRKTDRDGLHRAFYTQSPKG